MKDNLFKTIVTNSEKETRELGYAIGNCLGPGDTLCLTGDLGSGKTVITRGLVAALGGGDEVTSPTFTLLNIYRGKIPVYHFDVYRLEDQTDVEDIGFFDYVGRDGVAVIEWADLIPDFLPDRYIRMDIRRDFSLNSDFRKIDVYFNAVHEQVAACIERW